MSRHILYCTNCCIYTMQAVCSCGEKTAERKPPKYSPEDKYAQYRREAKAEERKKQGLI